MKTNAFNHLKLILRKCSAHNYSDKNKKGEKTIKAIEFAVALNQLVDRNQRTRFPSMERLSLIIVKAFGSDKKV